MMHVRLEEGMQPSMKKKQRRKASDLLDEFDLKMIMEALKLDRKRRVDYIV
ncbi:MAG: hypothetical protein QW160_04670 [Candidatus Bathyarchaeia archaeon]